MRYTQAKFEADQAAWLEKMTALNARNAKTDSAIAKLEELDQATPGVCGYGCAFVCVCVCG